MKAAIALILIALAGFFLYEVLSNNASTFTTKFQAGVTALGLSVGGAGASFGSTTPLTDADKASLDTQLKANQDKTQKARQKNLQ